MRVLVVCTGNVARSPALAALLRKEGLHEVRSAALGAKAKEMRPMAKQMRAWLVREQLEWDAGTHRSQRADQLPEGWPEAVVTLTPKHRKQAAERWPAADIVYAGPVKDPAWGGDEAYAQVFAQLKTMAPKIARELAGAAAG